MTSVGSPEQAFDLLTHTIDVTPPALAFDVGFQIPVHPAGPPFQLVETRSRSVRITTPRVPTTPLLATLTPDNDLISLNSQPPGGPVTVTIPSPPNDPFVRVHGIQKGIFEITVSATGYQKAILRGSVVSPPPYNTSVESDDGKSRHLLLIVD